MIFFHLSMEECAPAPLLGQARASGSVNQMFGEGGRGRAFSGWSVPVPPPSLRKALVIVANLSPAGTKPGSVPQPLRQVSYLTFRTAM